MPAKGFKWEYCKKNLHKLEGGNNVGINSEGRRYCIPCKNTYEKSNKRRESARIRNKSAYWNNRLNRIIQVRQSRVATCDYLIGIKGLRGCFDCKQWFPPEILEFDHVPERGKKKRDLGKFTNVGPKFLEELAKCDVVCPTCHKIRTISRGQYGSTSNLT